MPKTILIVGAVAGAAVITFSAFREGTRPRSKVATVVDADPCHLHERLARVAIGMPRADAIAILEAPPRMIGRHTWPGHERVKLRFDCEKTPTLQYLVEVEDERVATKEIVRVDRFETRVESSE